jgi:hypothetical protein
MHHNPQPEVSVKRFALSFLALIAVACSSGSQYERGAYTPPVRAPTFSPAEDAPHTRGQPGYVNGQRVERSPNRRYVEPSNEPQMMAADGDDNRAVELLINEPVPKATPDGIEDAEFAACWRDFDLLARGNKRELLTWSPEEVRCLRHKVLSHCGARMIEKRKARKYDPTFEDEMASKKKRACGRNDEFNTSRVVDFGNRMMEHGDSNAGFGWRP